MPGYISQYVERVAAIAAEYFGYHSCFSTLYIEDIISFHTVGLVTLSVLDVNI